MAKNQTKKANKKINLIILIAAIVLIISGIMIALFSGNGNKEKDKGQNEEKNIVSNEETVEEEYGFTKQDAIEVIKKIYNSDSYEFKAEVREDNMYIVTVSNPDTNSEYKYVVNPNDGSFSELK